MNEIAEVGIKPIEVIGTIIALFIAGDIFATVNLRKQLGLTAQALTDKISGVAKSLENLVSDFRQSLMVQNQHASKISFLEAENARLQTKLMIMEAKHDDMSGFLARNGYVKREFTSVVPSIPTSALPNTASGALGLPPPGEAK